MELAFFDAYLYISDKLRGVQGCEARWNNSSRVNSLPSSLILSNRFPVKMFIFVLLLLLEVAEAESSRDDAADADENSLELTESLGFPFTGALVALIFLGGADEDFTE